MSVRIIKTTRAALDSPDRCYLSLFLRPNGHDYSLYRKRLVYSVYAAIYIYTSYLLLYVLKANRIYARGPSHDCNTIANLLAYRKRQSVSKPGRKKKGEKKHILLLVQIHTALSYLIKAENHRETST